MHSRLIRRFTQVNIYLKNMQDYAAMNKTYIEMIPDPKPARTCVAVADLPFGTDVGRFCCIVPVTLLTIAQVEIECTAHL